MKGKKSIENHLNDFHAIFKSKAPGMIGKQTVQRAKNIAILATDK